MFNPPFSAESFMSHKPLYFLTHEERPHIFSGYGIPIQDGEKSPLVGILMVDRPTRCPESYIRDLKENFGFGDVEFGDGSHIQ